MNMRFQGSYSVYTAHFHAGERYADRMKQTYRPKLKLEVFFTGGAVSLAPSGRHVACACGDEVKVNARRKPSVAARLFAAIE